MSDEIKGWTDVNGIVGRVLETGAWQVMSSMHQMGEVFIANLESHGYLIVPESRTFPEEAQRCFDALAAASNLLIRQGDYETGKYCAEMADRIRKFAPAREIEG
jgi:hypothetical protein